MLVCLHLLFLEIQLQVSLNGWHIRKHLPWNARQHNGDSVHRAYFMSSPRCLAPNNKTPNRKKNPRLCLQIPHIMTRSSIHRMWWNRGTAAPTHMTQRIHYQGPFTQNWIQQKMVILCCILAIPLHNNVFLVAWKGKLLIPEWNF